MRPSHTSSVENFVHALGATTPSLRSFNSLPSFSQAFYYLFIREITLGILLVLAQLLSTLFYERGAFMTASEPLLPVNFAARRLPRSEQLLLVNMCLTSFLRVH